MATSAEALGVAGDGVAALAFFGLAGALLTAWRTKMKGSRLLPAALGSAAWAALLCAGSTRALPLVEWSSFEALRLALWFSFLIGILRGSGGRVGLPIRIGAYGGAAALAAIGLLGRLGWPLPWFSEPSVLVLVGLGLSILGLLLLEQVIRHTRQSQEWRVKFLWVAVGALFAYDLIFFSVSFLFRKLDLELWLARGYVNALAAPLLAIGVMRLRAWKTRVFMSPALAVYTTSVAMAGLYLLVMAFAGYYLRVVGGQWGSILEIVFFAAAAIGLAVLFYSGSARAWLRVFVAKYFFPYKYDYRTEWLSLARQLSEGSAESPLAESGKASNHHSILPIVMRNIETKATLKLLK